MDSQNIEDYKHDLLAVCSHCRRKDRCKDWSKLCLAKRLVFNLTKREYKRRLKKGNLNERS